MIPALAAINVAYLPLEDVMMPLEWSGGLLSAEFVENLVRQQSAVKVQHDTAFRQFQQIMRSLTPDEIMAGYQEGGRLLQLNLSGLMYSSFDPRYIPLMITAIREDHTHSAWLFVQALARHGGPAFADGYIQALESRSYRVFRSAVEALSYLRIACAVPLIEAHLHRFQPILQASIVEMVRRLQEDGLHRRGQEEP